MCQNCIEVDAPTISGIVVADVVATVFLAVAVYCVAGHNKGRMSRGEGPVPLAARGGHGECLGVFRSCMVPQDFPSQPPESLQAAGSVSRVGIHVSIPCTLPGPGSASQEKLLNAQSSPKHHHRDSSRWHSDF